jgi:5-methylcytosine-specific restriction endonuclease McrA
MEEAKLTHVDRLLQAGVTRAEIARRLGVSASTITRCARLLGYPDVRPRQSRTDWAAVKDDNQLENLVFLCPNCHSQTPNWGGRNRGAGRHLRAVSDEDAA